MKDFDARWQTAAALARQATRREEPAPGGFAARVVARSTPPAWAARELAWDRLLPQLLAGSVVVLALCAAVEVPHWRNDCPLEPGIENVVAQLVWSL
jgi:hypothetical protein